MGWTERVKADSVLALCWHGLGDRCCCSDLHSADGEAAVQELKAQARGPGPLPLLAGMRRDAEPQGLELVLPAPVALFGVSWFGLWPWMGSAALGIKDWVRWLGTWGRFWLWRGCCTVASCFFLFPI